MAKKLKTRDIAKLAIEEHGEQIEYNWKLTGKDKRWELLKDCAQATILTNYGVETLSKLSAQFIGYAAHYMFAHYVDKYGR